jgi:aldose 1-epimerase
MVANDLVTLESHCQRLQTLPRLGGSVIAWYWKSGSQWSPLFRPWDGMSEDPYTFSYYPLVPWSNRITCGGFVHDGVFYPIERNRHDEIYPIHGSGWLQPWEVVRQTKDTLRLMLESYRFNDEPYDYASTQTFTFLPQGLRIELAVTHLGKHPLPYGLGLHPIFIRNEATRLQTRMTGVWLAGADSIPITHTSNLPPTWDYNTSTLLDGPLIDNCFTGWDGKSTITYPDRGLTITMTMANCNGYNLLYRPPGRSYFAVEPVTHPVNAFHMEGKPGLVVLARGQSLSLKVEFFVEERHGSQ